MADVKNFGLIGVGSSLQFSKAGPKLVNNSGVFNFKAANGTTDTALTAAGITSSAGNVTLTTGNVVLTSTAGVISIGTDTSLSRSEAGVFSLDGGKAVVLPTGNTAARTGLATTGMIRTNNDSPTAAYIEYYNGTSWSTLATGGSTGTLQTEIDNIEASLGAAINPDGTFHAAGFVSNAVLSSPTSFTDAINQIATYELGHDTLNEIFPSSAIGNVIYSGVGNVWTQAAPGSAAGVQAWAQNLDNLTAKTTTGYLVQTGADTYGSASFAAAGGLTVTGADGTTGTTTFGTTGNLAGLNSMVGTGIMVRTGTSTFANRTITSTATGITFTDGDGIAGDPTLNVSGNIAQIDGLATVGFLVRHTGGSITTESLTGTAGNIVITNASGDAGSATIDLATVTQATSGTFSKVTLDGFGRVTGNTAVTTADVTALVNSQYLRLDGTTTMTGALNAGGQLISNVAAPVAGSDAANKSYVDNAVSGLSWKQAVSVIAAGNVVIAGPGTTVDGVTLANGDRVLLKGQTTASENGIYVFNGAAVAMTRAADALTPVSLQGAAVFAEAGTYANTAWVQTIDPLATFAAQVWTQFSGAGSYAGSGAITVSGTTIGLTSGNGLSQAGGTLVVTAAGAITVASGSVAVTLDTTTTGGLDQTGGALRIKAAGVTNAMLANTGFTLDANTGTGTIALGDTLDIKGDVAQGVSVSLTLVPDTFHITVADATASQKGVATFNAGDFAVTAGDVTIKTGGVDNAQLVNSTISLAGNTTTGTPSVALGTTLTVSSADGAITTTASGASVSLQLNTVDVAHGGTGVTSFVANEVMYADASSAFAQSANFTFNGTSTLTVGGALPLAFNGALGSISATATDSDLVLMPNGAGSVVVGPVGAGLIQSDAGTALTVRGNAGLTISGGTNGVTVVIASGTNAAKKVSLSGPTATDYATNLGANDLTNKQYVDDAIATGAAAGAIKAYQRTVPLNANGTTPIPLTGTMPAGATVLSVKVMVTVVDTGATLSVGKASAIAAYMTTSENDPQAAGIYMSECFVTEASAEGLIATVASSSGSGSGSCVVIVTYQVAQ